MVKKCCHVCGEQFLALLKEPDQEPPFYCHTHITQAPWYRRYFSAPNLQSHQAKDTQ